MNMSLLYHYILTPNKTLAAYSHTIPLKEAIVVICLSALSTFTTVGIIFPTEVLPIWVLIVIGYVAWFFIQGVTIDFLAQLAQGKAQSVKTTTWLVLATLPLLGAVPLDILSKLIGYPFTLLGQLSILPLVVLMAVLQVNVIKVLYDFSTVKAILIYIAPVILPIVVAIGWFILLATGL